MERLLIEIGTEEIPSGYIEPALQAFRSILIERLGKERIECGDAYTCGTPRRLAVIVDNVAARQTPVVTEMTGPPERVAFDENGRPTVAAQKFAEKAGISLDRIGIRETGKGRYLCTRRTEKGKSTIGILKQALPELILAIPFPKTMRWKDLHIAFARPIHSVAALYGSRMVSFLTGDVKSGRYTFGHRFLSPGKIRLNHPDDYLEKLESAFVIADIDRRKTSMMEKMRIAVSGVGGVLVDDDALCDSVTHLVEFPEVVLGAFDRKFLELPPEILITAMREHQRYFAVIDAEGAMMPNFVAVSNNRAGDMGVVRAGNERVLAARLEDARFFYNTDLRESTENRVEKLKSVVFQAQLGSLFDKTRRVRQLCVFLAGKTGLEAREKELLDRAAAICKADLVSQVVIEFPKLQGVIGRIYAGKTGEPEPVARAVEEHYRPVYSGGGLPETRIGSIVAIADKLDTLCGCFLAGLSPTGQSDPYALRRQAIGLIQIMKKEDFDILLPDIIEYGMHLFACGNDASPEEAIAAVLDFFQNRMSHMLEEDSIPKDMAAAVLAASTDNIPDVWRRARAFHQMKSRPDFHALAAAFKRVVNIIRKADTAETGEGEVQSFLFENPAEASLHAALVQTEQQVALFLDRKDAEAAFTEIAGIKESVDRFFDEVMVMTEDARLRRNRLALLKRISDLFVKLADFSRLST